MSLFTILPGSSPANADCYWPSDLTVDRTKPEFSFELTSEAAHKNYLVLKNKYNLDLKAAVNGHSYHHHWDMALNSKTQRYLNLFSSSILSGPN
jgi:hypothetical protein